ncbi:hypothetical protein [Lactococcus petauri]|uniref:hypothetical protein n=1 Tax=Lactococcus petauri TaxID=1940789 RepID=UPI0010345A4F|nr:hypothetical protein [Lactococcus petauri]MCV5952565.1 hypothetical protein [Lactococcus petauri]MCV5969782.1 hypothetical protein [Lactococcus petauri]MCV5980420.1 hypothetical protein [Lactococcus petauri]TBH82431.1 hypothetical protein EX190_00225 [Lactococcus petauri]
MLLIDNKKLDEVNAMTYNFSAQHSTAQHSTAQHSTAQHSTAQQAVIFRLAAVGLLCFEEGSSL